MWALSISGIPCPSYAVVVSTIGVVAPASITIVIHSCHLEDASGSVSPTRSESIPCTKKGKDR